MDGETLRHYTAWHRHVNERRYDAPADPWGQISVDPSRIDDWTGAVGLDRGLGRVEGGDWDRDRDPFRETTTYRGLAQRFDAGLDWEDTAIYERAGERFASGETVRGYESLAAFERRCAYLDGLYERIRSEGYRPNARADHDNPAADRNAFEDAPVHHLEPLVAVGRNGDVLLTEGFHRVAIADILGVDAVPVQVLCRHERWQRVRDRVHARPAGEKGSFDVDLDHPDLADLRE